MPKYDVELEFLVCDKEKITLDAPNVEKAEEEAIGMIREAYSTTLDDVWLTKIKEIKDGE